MTENTALEHPDQEELSQYVRGSLPGFGDAWIEEHLAECSACAEAVRRVECFENLWDTWAADAHGAAAQRAELDRALQRAEAVEAVATTPDLLTQLRSWNRQFRGTVSGAIKVLVHAAGERSRLLTDGVANILCPAPMPAFAVSLVTPGRRGVVPSLGDAAQAPPPPAIRADSMAPAGPSTHVVLEGQTLRVSVAGLAAAQAPPLVVLVPQDESAPQVQRLWKDDASGSYVAHFELAPGPYTLTFLWL
jgi:hypothetical protein